MSESSEEVQLTKLESILVTGIIGCLLFATWELGHLMADDWLRGWVQQDSFARRRIILYGIAFLMAIGSVLLTTRFAFDFGRFGKTLNRAFLWYGVILLISTIAIFVFDCLPEVFAGFIGAAVFVLAIYVLQKRYFTRERVIRNRIQKSECYACGTKFPPGSMYCPNCGSVVGKKCPGCQTLLQLSANFCVTCGVAIGGSEVSAAAKSHVLRT